MKDAPWGQDDSSAPLIGRERELVELSELVTKNRVVLVYGEAGVGKTSLVVEACRRAARIGLVPDPVHLSLAGIIDPREAVERSAKAVGEPRPTPTPGRVAYALSAILERTPRTLIWDDLDERSTPFGIVVRRFQEANGTARLVLVSRRHPTAKEAAFRAPAMEVKPLGREDAVRLVRALEAARERTLAESLADATGGNPLLIRLAMADETRVPGDATVAMKRYVEEHATGIAGKVLALLAAADAPLDEHELSRAAGKGAREAIDDLRKYLLVIRDTGRVALAPPAAPIVREELGDADPAVWRALARIGESALAASALDDSALLIVCRAKLELGDPERVIAILHEHGIARAATPTAALDRLLRDVAARSRSSAGAALRTLAREQLRVGDYDSARRTLDELPAPRSREEGERVALLRAEAHIRAGEPAAAQRAIDAVGKGGARENPGLVLTRAQLAILRGELADARATLERVAPKTDAVAQLEARRGVQIAASHLYEERYDLTHAWVARARATQIAAGIPVEPVVTILDVHALLGLGDVERADEVREREARGRPDAPALEIASLVRRGELLSAIDLGDAALASQDRRADLLFRSVLARDLARAYHGVGQLAKAARMMRLAEAGADEPSLAALRPICDAELARLADAEGDHARARRYIDRAFAKIPSSPFVAIDRDVLHGRVPIAPRDAPPVVRAYAALRVAEISLALAGPDETTHARDGARAKRNANDAAHDPTAHQSALETARDGAVVAERFFAGARLHRETSRARLARGEALARLGDRDAADEALSACEDLAAPRGYTPLVVSCALVRAAIAEGRGDLASAARALEGAVRAAGDGVDAALERAASRLDVAVRTPRGDAAARKPYEAIIDRLGLARPADVVWRVGPRTYLATSDGAPPERVACTVDVAERSVESSPDRTLELPEQRIALLCALAEAGDQGATLEELFGRVWRGTFHPLRHRNAVYVALTRLKESLKPLAREIRISHDQDRYRLSGPLPVAVRRRADRDGLRAALDRTAE